MFAAELRLINDERQSRRRRVSMPGRVGQIGSQGAVCRVADLSAEGARLRLFDEIEAGATVELAFPGPTIRRAKVVWVRGLEAGCAFDAPINEALLEELAGLFGFKPALHLAAPS